MSVTKIRMTGQELFGTAGTPRVVVFGGGFGGSGVGVKLKEAGIDTFAIYESSLAIDGFAAAPDVTVPRLDQKGPSHWLYIDRWTRACL